MKIAIVDDEEHCREELAALLRAYGGPHGCRIDLVESSGAEEFLDALQRERFSLVFMDIFLAGLDGVAAAVKLWEADKRRLLVCVYVLFYQYQALQEHMRQTARLRHDFRYPLRLLSALAEREDLAGVRSHLAEYERILAEKAPVNYCANAA